MDDRLSDVVKKFRAHQDYDLAELLEAMAESTDCSKVWNAIEKRLAVATKLHKVRIRKIPLYADLDANSVERWARKNIRSEVRFLTSVVERGLRVPSFCDSATVTQRKRLNEKFSKAAASMIEMLEQLAGGERSFDEPESALVHFAASTAQDACEQMLDVESGISTEGRGEADADARIAVQVAVRNCVAHPERLIDLMRDDVLRWAGTDPLIAKPDATNARRLRLIRTLSRYFKLRYGTPLRACTLAITGVFFDIDGLSEASIAKLAP